MAQFFSNSVCQIQTHEGTAGEYGNVSWQILGHYSLNAAGYVALFSQISGYINGIQLPAGSTSAIVQINDYNGRYTVRGEDLGTQASDILGIISNTANLNGGA